MLVRAGALVKGRQSGQGQTTNLSERSTFLPAIVQFS